MQWRTIVRRAAEGVYGKEALERMRRRASPRRAAGVALLFMLLPPIAFALGEFAGWPFLAGPLADRLSQGLGRAVRLAPPADPAAAGAPRPFSVHFLGGLRIVAPGLEIAAPAWSDAPFLLRAADVELDLRYLDLWRARQGEPLRIERLRARTLDARLERRADGRSTWQFGPPPAAGDAAPSPWPWPRWGRLQVDDGRLRLRDAPLALALDARLAMVDGDAAGAAHPSLRLDASGLYQRHPVTIALASAGALPWLADAPGRGAGTRPAVPLTLQARVGRATLAFAGTATDAVHLGGLAGRFTLAGPSLAAVGDPVGITLPTTGAFRSTGRLAKQGGTWSVVVDDATVGASRLQGAFVYERGAPPAVPRVAGRLTGTRLLLADLGPAIGQAVPAAPGASAPAAPTRTRGAGKVLPARPFDLASLRRMDAAIAIDLAEVDLNTPRLAPLRPLRATLSLVGGVLALDDLDARSAGGRLQGRIALDGRGPVALWRTDLRWDGLQLAQWLRLPRAGNAPPWIAGRLDGRAALQGRGLSTADFLATLAGDVRARLQDGAVSHLAVEAAGIDLAQALGMWIKGDDLLPVQCALVDLAAEAGVLRPRVAVLDTRDSAVWADGTLSLATETVALRVVVVPRDFSPLALRAPLHLDGPLGAPRVSLDKAPLARRLGGALLLGLLNPLAALLPLIDPGDDAAATHGAAGCRAMAQRLPAAGVGAAASGRTRR